MKHLRTLLMLTLVASLASFSIARADSYDSDDATIQKKTDHSVTVKVDKGSYVVPVKFADGADWSAVKDHYELSDASLACVKSGKAKLTVGSDGGASWSK